MTKPTEPTEPLEPVDWQSRLQASVTIYRSRRARIQADRAMRARRRQYGLVRRYQAKQQAREPGSP